MLRSGTTVFIRQVLSNNRIPGLVATTQSPSTQTLSDSTFVRYYISRAHGQSKDQFHIRQAVQLALDGVLERTRKRVIRLEKNLAKDDTMDASTKDERLKNCDESIDIAIDTGLDPRKPNQALRGSVSLPHGSGKVIRIAAFSNDEAMQAAARDAGATVVGGDDLISDIANGNALNFDRAVATPDMVGSLGRVARILGPRGLLPAAKLGTISSDISSLVTKQLSGLVPYRTDRKGDIHACVGKASFGEEKLMENIRAFMQEMQDEKPEGAKGIYLRQVYITSTQGKSFKVSLPTIDPSSPLFMVDLEEAAVA